MHNASFDNELLNDWCDFCEEKMKFDKFHFSTLLMETLLEGFTPEFDKFIVEVTKYFDKSIYENIKYAFSDENASQGGVKDWVISDLREKQKIIDRATDYRKLNKIIDSPQFLFVDDRDKLYHARGTDNSILLYEVVGDFVMENIDNDNRLFALIEALYNIASDYNLVYALLSGLFIKNNVDLFNYLDIYKNGCDYAVDDEKIVVYEFRPSR